MASCPTSCMQCAEVGRVTVDMYGHSTGVVPDDSVWVHCTVVQELSYGCCCVLRQMLHVYCGYVYACGACSSLHGMGCLNCANASQMYPGMDKSMVWHLLSLLVYLIPKSSTIRQKVMSSSLCFHRPGSHVVFFSGTLEGCLGTGVESAIDGNIDGACNGTPGGRKGAGCGPGAAVGNIVGADNGTPGGNPGSCADGCVGVGGVV
eukprot:15365780-Ditylum_brightwellii.AAC.1